MVCGTHFRMEICLESKKVCELKRDLQYIYVVDFNIYSIESTAA